MSAELSEFPTTFVSTSILSIKSFIIEGENKMESRFLMWGERGLVATFLLDMSDNFSKEFIKDFLALIELADRKNIQFSPNSLKCVVEPDFGNKGFGHPDGLIILEDQNNKKIVIILEAKRKRYDESDGEPELRGEDGYNSSINGQLELNYCLTIALSNFKPSDQYLEEPDWILKTPYNGERRNKKKILKNNVVIKNIVEEIAYLDIKAYYHLIVSYDKENPLLKVDENVHLPEIYSEQYPTRNVWGEFKSNFGWINYDKIETIIKHHVIKGKYIDSFDFNKDNLGNAPGTSDSNASYIGKKLSILKQPIRQLSPNIKTLIYDISKCFTNSSDCDIETRKGSINIKKDERVIGKIVPLIDGVFIGFRDYSLSELGLGNISFQGLYEIKIGGGQAFWGVKVPVGQFNFQQRPNSSFTFIMKSLIKQYIEITK